VRHGATRMVILKSRAAAIDAEAHYRVGLGHGDHRLLGFKGLGRHAWWYLSESLNQLGRRLLALSTPGLSLHGCLPGPRSVR